MQVLYPVLLQKGSYSVATMSKADVFHRPNLALPRPMTVIADKVQPAISSQPTFGSSSSPRHSLFQGLNRINEMMRHISNQITPKNVLLTGAASRNIKSVGFNLVAPYFIALNGGHIPPELRHLPNYGQVVPVRMLKQHKENIDAGTLQGSRFLSSKKQSKTGVAYENIVQFSETRDYSATHIPPKKVAQFWLSRQLDQFQAKRLPEPTVVLPTRPNNSLSSPSYLWDLVKRPGTTMS